MYLPFFAGNACPIISVTLGMQCPNRMLIVPPRDANSVRPPQISPEQLPGRAKPRSAGRSVLLTYKVPPGVNAEYGYLLLKEDNEVEGMEFLDKEMGLYPESVIFIQRIKGK
jgi:hypothetical protein